MDQYQISHQTHNNLNIVLNPNGRKLAMKRLKRGECFNNIEEVKNDKEIRFLSKLKHDNIIPFMDVIYNSTDRTGFIVLPYYEMNLLELIQKQMLQEYQKRHLIKQMFEALEYIHSQGIFHRDLHPENIMVEEKQYSMDKLLYDAKLIDFGSSKSKGDTQFTDYVGVRWYRAPELLLRSPQYNESVDIFALGCIIYEIYHRKALFPAQSELQMLNEQCVILGTPLQNEWPEGLLQAEKLGIQLGHFKKSNLKMIFNEMPEDMVDLCSMCLKWNPSLRIKPKDALLHESIKNAI